MLANLWKRRKAVVLAVGLSLLTATGAVAYFTSTGSNTGQASVGTATAFTVNINAATGGPLYPGSGTETLTYTVHNAGSGSQNLSATTAAVASVNNDVTSHGTEVVGCKSAWFTATNTAPSPLPQDLAGGATSTQGSVAVTMSDSGTNQNACENVTPDITVSAS